MTTVQELIEALEKIEDKTKTIGISYYDDECRDLLICESDICLRSYEDIKDNEFADIDDYENPPCDYYL